jgi:ER degradation enhancer, mannosidase alpha-like 2
LLDLAVDLGDRLLPAFRTATGIPYGTVNLAKGVPKGETELASTAGAGSLVLEFEVLSYLTGDVKYGRAAMKAAEEIFHRRSELGLVGKHIHVRSGKWHETLSGVGSNSDSFYEYLIKAYLLFRRKEYYNMFTDVFKAVKTHSMSGDWFVDVDMYSGKMRKKRSENLQAFWPGMEAMLGMTESSARLLNSFYIVWKDVGFLPEEFDYLKWSPGKSGAVSQLYPLRPELIESTYLHYRATGDRSWLVAGREFLLSLETHTRTECGYATVKDVISRELEDSMPSFFLSETCKYLYLLFDEHNFIHDRGYIFTTEAHPIDPMQLAAYSSGSKPTSKTQKGKNSGFLELFDRFFGSLTGAGTDSDGDAYIPPSVEEEEGEKKENADDDRSVRTRYLDWKHGRDLHASHMKCPKAEWWNHSPYVRFHNAIEDVADSQDEAGDDLERVTADGSNGLGIEQIFKMLAGNMNKPNRQKKQDPLDGKTLCNVEDDPSLANLSPDGSSIPEPAQVQERVVELEVGNIGKFMVSIFPDGFVVKSKKYGNTIEIAGVGQSAIFVKEFNDTHSSTASASFGGGVTVCNVRMKVDWPVGLGGDLSGKEIWGAREYDKDFLPSELERER